MFNYLRYMLRSRIVNGLKNKPFPLLLSENSKDTVDNTESLALPPYQYLSGQGITSLQNMPVKQQLTHSLQH